ncbi:hypothetical protein ACFWBH_24615 [Streptomyces sp. NPDC059999]|uniref:hypothetical protein n=1 Tax=unclassified Streptomyces TaxID=2593676 RepID=UPI0036874B34
MQNKPERSRRASDPDRLLGLYLNDHLAGAGAGVALLRRMTRSHRDTAAEPRLVDLAEAVTADRDSLREIMTALDVPLRHRRMLLGVLAEKAGRLKLNGRLISRSPLSDVLELEAIRVGVEGKKELWRALRIVSRFDQRIDGEAMGRLLARAERQADALETLRLTAVEGAFDARAHRRPRGVTPRPHPRMT